MKSAVFSFEISRGRRARGCPGDADRDLTAHRRAVRSHLGVGQDHGGAGGGRADRDRTPRAQALPRLVRDQAQGCGLRGASPALFPAEDAHEPVLLRRHRPVRALGARSAAQRLGGPGRGGARMDGGGRAGGRDGVVQARSILRRVGSAARAAMLRPRGPDRPQGPAPQVPTRAVPQARARGGLRRSGVHQGGVHEPPGRVPAQEGVERSARSDGIETRHHRRRSGDGEGAADVRGYHRRHRRGRRGGVGRAQRQGGAAKARRADGHLGQRGPEGAAESVVDRGEATRGQDGVRHGREEGHVVAPQGGDGVHRASPRAARHARRRLRHRGGGGGATRRRVHDHALQRANLLHLPLQDQGAEQAGVSHGAALRHVSVRVALHRPVPGASRG